MRWGRGGECQFTRTALRFPTHWTGGASGVSRLTLGTVASTLSPSSLVASRWPLDVSCPPSSRQNGSWFTAGGQQRPTASYPSPPSSREPALHHPPHPPLTSPPPPSRPICHTPPTSGHLERSPPQSPQQPPSTPQTPARNCKYPAACLRPTLHNTTGSPPRVWPSTTRPSVRLTFFDPVPVPAPARPDCIAAPALQPNALLLVDLDLFAPGSPADADAAAFPIASSPSRSAVHVVVVDDQSYIGHRPSATLGKTNTRQSPIPNNNPPPAANIKAGAQVESTRDETTTTGTSSSVCVGVSADLDRPGLTKVSIWCAVQL